MVEFINAYTGTLMRVADNRKDEYMAAGHKLAAAPLPENKPEEVEVKPVKTVKKTTKKR